MAWDKWRDPQTPEEYRQAYGMDDEPPAVEGPFTAVGLVPYLCCRHGNPGPCEYCREEMDSRR